MEMFVIVFVAVVVAGLFFYAVGLLPIIPSPFKEILQALIVIGLAVFLIQTFL